MVVEADPERGLVMRILLHSPKDLFAGALAVAAIGAIVANALFLQSGPHPSPMFGSVVTLPAPAPSPVSLLPRPRPAEATKAEGAPAEPRAVESRTADTKAADAKAVEPKVADTKASDTKAADPLTNLVKATSAAHVATSSIPRPPAPIPFPSHNDNLAPGGSRRVAGVPRALTDYGYRHLE